MKLKQLIIFISLFISVFFVSCYGVPAKATGTLDLGAGKVTGIGKDIGFNTSNTNLLSVIAGIINYILSFIGVIFLLLVIYGGFKWMTARGNTKEVEAGQAIMTRAIGGMLVIFAAYALTYFVISVVSRAAGVPTTTPAETK